MKSSFLAFVVLAVSGYAEASTYSRTASLSGQSFLNAFSWQSIADPTHGRVNYLSQSAAQSAGLYSVSGNTVTLRADHTNVLSPSGPGRNSFRIMSNNQYSTHVAIFDIGHMPEGCGTWPAVWFVQCFTLRRTLTLSTYIYLGPQELGANWPNEGEIDIVEGVNNKVPNQSTLHTSANCATPPSRRMTGTSVGNDCDVYTSGNAGCGVHLADGNSFGPNFNKVGGGWYAIERSSTHIAIWFWERGSSSIPSQVKYPGGTVDTSTWGTPAAFFPNTNCDFSSHLGPMNIIINLTFCGDWAGAVYSSDECPSSCVDYVNNNPSAFANAYFEFNALNIYQ
ncbi:glycoside hydrolase family 16 protein [Boletus reticuloceps]|uniref:Glycoside hydrolase family 16 protein n=1 Tax=Boletus reticuloceps TaxID=495285 RepID=A0A8I3A9M7_9AGAM|nr:glycoside hydrolase family 16 protein [Boletus reticuloceps]